MRKLWLTAFLMSLAAAHPALAADGCTDNWSTIAGTVAANNLTSAKDLQRLAKAKMAGKLVKVSLCQAYGSFQYQLVFLDVSGQLATLTVDARNPFPQ